jgi:hypothetical protein
MSGGSYDYICHKLDNVVDDIRDNGECGAASPELRKLFKEHLKLVAKTLRAIEWNDSGDGDDDEASLIRECLKLDKQVKRPEYNYYHYPAGTKVLLKFSTELDRQGHWAISLPEEPEFWLDAYFDKEKAETHCKNSGWIIVNPS